VGASLYIDNIKTGLDPSQSALSSSDLSQIQSVIQYSDQTPVSLSVVINNVAFNSDPAQTTSAAWDSLLQKIAAQNDPRMANIQVTKTGDALTVRSTNPGQGFSIGALSTTSPILAMSNQVLVPNEDQGDAISAIHQLSELPNIRVAKGQQATAQDLEAARFLQLQVGANNGQYLEIELPDYGPPGGAIDALVWDAVQPRQGAVQDPSRLVIHIKTSQAAEQALLELDATLSTVLTDRARLGASMNRLIHVGDNLSQMHLEQSKSRSGIQDTNFAVSASELVKSQIINQAAMSVLAQANAQPQYVMELLKTQR
jgi:flagellin